MSAGRGGPFPEIGGIVHLDHVNFPIGDQDLATKFFIAGLGLTRDPYQRTDHTNMGINLGLEQFHLPRRAEVTPPFHGEVGLVVPDLAVIEERLTRLADDGAFAGSRYAFEASGQAAVVTSPFGFVLRLHAAGSIASHRALGIVYVEVAVPLGSSAAIGRFYADMFDAPTNERIVGNEPAVEVAAGPFQFLRFVERNLRDYETHEMHVSYYATRFNAVRRRLAKTDPTIAADRRDHVFFFRNISDPENGELAFAVNNEVRSLYHADFGRRLVNRWPIVAEPFVN